MAEADILTKNYLSDKKRFADLFNVFAFDGRELIEADSLVDEDTSLTEKELLFQRQRDVLKSMSDGKQKLILLGIESQSSSHKSMPLRIMEYDALTYRRQLENKRKELIPVMTLVLYWGSDPWKGPRSLQEMMGQESREMFEGLY